MASQQDYNTLMACLKGLNDLKEDLKFLLDGVSEFDIRGDSIASEVMVHGPLAFPIAVTPAGKTFIAGARYGQGRVILVSHEWFLSRNPLSTFMNNAMKWLSCRKGVIGVQPKYEALHAFVTKSGLDFQFTGLRKDLSVYICTSYNDDQCAEIQEFVAGGGGLLIGGHAWYWAQTHCGRNVMTDCPGNRILNKMGLSLLEKTLKGGLFKAPKIDDVSKEGHHFCRMLYRNDFKEDLKFLLDGVSEFDIRGDSIASEVMVHGPLAFPIAVTPAGKTFIAGARYGQGRVILVSHEWFLSRNPLSTFMNNAMKWLSCRKGVIGVQPKYEALHAFVTKSGLDFQLTDLKKDLSVYICTSYNDDQCAEIQEFVAGGGSLLIGGHAWYWAQTHCGRNVMTDCPGNRILNKMGLSLLEKTLKGGLFKAPKIDDVCKEGYHFCRMLQRFVEHVNLGKELTDREQNCLKQLGNDCASYLSMRSHESAAYTSIVALLSDLVKKAGVPQVCSKNPVKSAKDRLMLLIGSELYKVSPDPDALLPYIIKDRPNLPTLSNSRVQISANTGAHEEWISTGLYLSPGMKTYIEIPQEIVGKNWQVQLGCQTDNIGGADVLKRAPVVHERFPLDKKKVQICNLWGGLIYLIAPPRSKVNKVEIVVGTSVQAPYFKSGVTSVADWVGRIRQAPAPWAELEFENIIMTLESHFVRNLDRPDEVAKLWDAIMRSITDLAARPAKLPRKERFVADVQISCGFMHSGYPIMMHSESAQEIVNIERAYKIGLWGHIHELGHNQQRSVWEFPPHTTECTCNLWSVYVHEEVLGMNRAIAHDYRAITPEKRNARIIKYFNDGKDFNSWSVWTALETYMQLQEKFGWDAFKKVFKAYHDMQGVPNDNAGKMNLYAETFSKVVKMNLSSFFKVWGWPIQPDTEQKLSHLPKWADHPVVQYA